MALLSLIARLGLDKTGFDAGIQGAQRRVDAFAGNVKGALAGAFSTAAVGAFLQSVVQATGRIKDLSEQFGITTDEVQKTDFALKQSGMEFESLGAALTKLGAARREAVEGNEELRQTFSKYGLTLGDLNDPQQRNYDLMLKLAKAMSEMNVTAAEQVEIADLLGAKASKLANVMNDLANAEPPALFSKDDIENIDKAVKAFERLKLSVQTLVAPLIGNELGKLNAIVEDLKKGNLVGAAAKFARFTPGGAAAIGVDATARALGGAAANTVKANDPSKILFDEMGRPLTSPAPGGLFEVDKNKNEARDGKAGKSPLERILGVPLPGADSLGRIGAFSGGGQSEVARQLKENVNLLREIRVALTDRGIKIREL